MVTLAFGKGFFTGVAVKIVFPETLQTDLFAPLFLPDILELILLKGAAARFALLKILTSAPPAHEMAVKLKQFILFEKGAAMGTQSKLFRNTPDANKFVSDQKQILMTEIFAAQ